MTLRISLIALLALLITGCSKPLPQDRINYAGEWRAPQMYLLIDPDGRVSYERRNGANTSSVNAPIKEFVGDDFVVGMAFVTTTFEVSEAPHLNNGQWEMVVDGVRVTRPAGAAL